MRTTLLPALLPALLLCGLAALIVACDDNGFSPSSVKEVTWKLESIERAGSAPMQAPTVQPYTLRLNNDGQLSVRAGCNDCTGTYILNGATLTIGPLQCTSISCGAGSIDGTYEAVLVGTSQLEKTSVTLVLKNSQVTLRFRS